MRLDELRHQRARDMLAVIDRAPATSIEDLGTGLRAGSARELEWLAPEVDLHHRRELRQPAKLHTSVAIVSPFTPSILIVTYTARYFLGHCEGPHGDQAHGAPAGTARDVYVLYGALRPALLSERRYDRAM